MNDRSRIRSGGAVALFAGISLVAAGCGGSSTPKKAAGDNPTVAPTSAAPTSAPASASSAPVAAGGCTATSLGYAKLASLKGVKVGFSQSEPAAAAFRLAETKSMKDEAAKQGAVLIDTNANNQPAKQIADIKDMITRGAKLLIVAPLNSDGLQPALDAAKAAKVPVVTVDRLITSKPCTDYLTFIGSNFVSQGKRAADAMITATGGKGKIIVLLGSSGNNVTTDRTSGFVNEVKTKGPGLTVVAQQTGNFNRQDGQKVMAQLLQAHPDVTGVYAENDEMGVGAVNAISAAGKSPGKGVKIVSIDGTHDAVKLLTGGRYNGVIESNPRFGPLAFKALMDFESDTAVPNKIIISDDEYNPQNAASKLGNAF